jgi:predicted nucleotidyltransferase
MESKDYNIIFECCAGSRLYGTSTETSDYDFRGVVIPSKEYFFGFAKKVEQIIDSKDGNDRVLWELRKFFSLALDCNPSIIEILFVTEDRWIQSSDIWKQIISHRDWFVSKKARWTFSGYAISQLKRIKRHRSWLLNPPAKMPERGDFGLPSDRALVSKDQIGAFNVLLSLYMEYVKSNHPLKDQIDEMMETKDFIGLVQSVGNRIDHDILRTLTPIGDNLLLALSKEKAYIQTYREWEQYKNWEKERNADRAELERKFFYDCKHASHLYRLVTEGEELLRTGFITLPRPDREILVDIRNGKFTYDQMMELVGDIDSRFNALYDSSSLPRSADVNKVDEMCVDIVQKSLGLGNGFN